MAAELSDQKGASVIDVIQFIASLIKPLINWYKCKDFAIDLMLILSDVSDIKSVGYQRYFTTICRPSTKGNVQ